MPHRHRRRTGFSLAELLIVIGIIVVLVSLLMPALAGAKRQANTTKCLANLRSLGQAFQLYEVDHKGVWPVAVHHSSGHIPIGVPEARWPDMIAKYAANAKGIRYDELNKLKDGTVIWGCPAWQGSYEGSGSSDAFAEKVRVGYGMQYTPFDQKWGEEKFYAYIHSGVDGRYVHTRDWRVRGSERALLADSMTHILEAPASLNKNTLWQPFHTSVYASGMFTFDARRHGKASTTKDQTWNGRFGNMLFCDGHAATVNVREAYNAVRNPGTNSTPD